MNTDDILTKEAIVAFTSRKNEQFMLMEKDLATLIMSMVLQPDTAKGQEITLRTNLIASSNTAMNLIFLTLSQNSSGVFSEVSRSGVEDALNSLLNYIDGDLHNDLSLFTSELLAS